MKIRQLPGLSICQTHKVAPATAKDYVEVFGEVVAFALSVPQFRWDDPAIVDQMLVGLFDDRLLEGVHAGWSGKVFSAMGYCLPAFASGGKSLFPRAKAAQTGWKKITPSRSRLPMTFELACGLFHVLMVMGRLGDDGDCKVRL